MLCLENVGSGKLYSRTSQAIEMLPVRTGGQTMQELDYEKVGDRIRQIRKAKGWSQVELAKKCGVSMNFIGHIERGPKKMSLDTFTNICRELEADADVLLWGIAKSSEMMVKDYNYSMYSRIMKSLADIMSIIDGCPKQASAQDQYYEQQD